jgi:hypothetical protein
MHRVSQIILPNGVEIELYYQKGQLAYSFDFDGKPYGTKITLPSRTVLDIATSCLMLFTNAEETYKELTKTK